MSGVGDVKAVGDAALLVDVRPDVRHSVASAVRLAGLEGAIDVVAGEGSVLVRFRSGCNLDAAANALRAVVANGVREEDRRAAADEVEIAMRYDGADLVDIARSTGMSCGDVVTTHLAADYIVAFMGFVPGFPYLDGLPDMLNVSRLATPRVRVEPGSVAIAGSRCCIYPGRTPGGWRIIGHTDQVLFDPSRVPPALLSAGVRVRFVEA